MSLSSLFPETSLSGSRAERRLEPAWVSPLEFHESIIGRTDIIYGSHCLRYFDLCHHQRDPHFTEEEAGAQGLNNFPKVTQWVGAKLRLELRQAGSRVSALNSCTILPLSSCGYLSCLKFTFLLYERCMLVPASFGKVEGETRAQTYGQAPTQGP